MVLLEPEFEYTKDINEINPITLNITLSKIQNDVLTFELRKKIQIKLTDSETKQFWINFFSNSLEGKKIKASMIIAFRDRFGSACKLKQMGLLKPKTKIITD
jgi:hypothetical protein